MLTSLHHESVSSMKGGDVREVVVTPVYSWPVIEVRAWIWRRFLWLHLSTDPPDVATAQTAPTAVESHPSWMLWGADTCLWPGCCWTNTRSSLWKKPHQDAVWTLSEPSALLPRHVPRPPIDSGLSRCTKPPSPASRRRWGSWCRIWRSTSTRESVTSNWLLCITLPK